jgi:DnaJ-class molecular chaperone
MPPLMSLFRGTLAAIGCYSVRVYFHCPKRGFRFLPSSSALPFRPLYVRWMTSSGDGEGDGRLTHYDQLGLTPRASSEDVKKAYFDLTKKFHPDVNPENSEAMKRFYAITEAYEVLGDPRKRRDYDLKKFGRSDDVDTVSPVEHADKAWFVQHGEFSFRNTTIVRNGSELGGGGLPPFV